MSIVGVLPFTLFYVLDWRSSWTWAVRLFLGFSVLSLFVYQFAGDGKPIKNVQGFLTLYLSVLAILFISSFVSLSFEYLVYNQIDVEYKYKREDRSYQSVARHRQERGLPPPFPKSNLEIEEKYGFAGLVKEKQPGYVINFLYAFLFYPVGVLFSYLLENDGSKHRREKHTKP